MDQARLEALLTLGACLWVRSLGLFLLTPWLALGRAPALFGITLSLALACAVTPLCAAGPLPTLEHGLWLSLLGELGRGLVIALGCGLPFVVLRVTGGIVDSLTGALPDAAGSGRLARLLGFAALVIAVSAGALSGALRLLLDQTVLPTFTEPHVRELGLGLAELCWRAFALGVSLSGPVLLGATVTALLVGILGRVVPAAPVAPVGAALMPWLGLALLCLCLANWLDVVPELVRSFARSTTRLWAGMP